MELAEKLRTKDSVSTFFTFLAAFGLSASKKSLLIFDAVFHEL